MSKKNLYYVLCLDASPSMREVTEVTQKGANEIVAALKNAARENDVNIKFTCIAFSDDVSVLQGLDGIDIEDVKSIEKYQLGFGTAIYDGLGVAIEKLQGKLKKSDHACIVLLTDGQNNTKINHDEESVEKLVKKHKYTYAIVAADQDARELGNSVGIKNAVDYVSTKSGTRSAFFHIARASRNLVSNFANNKLDEKFFDDFDMSKTIMSVNGMKMTVNLPESAHEEVDGLPAYSPVQVNIVDEYPSCPSSWMHGSSKASSYFIPVKENSGMWFDFNDNLENEHDVAVVISVQGINPITGQKTSELRLEKYEKKCPIHDAEFGQDRFCQACGFKWPAQNYLSTTSCKNGEFWLDGFRTPDGTVRQYVFTEETARGVANAIIGNDKVYAVGIAFYKSKQPKPKPVYSGVLRSYTSQSFFSPMHTPQNFQARGLGFQGYVKMHSKKTGRGPIGPVASCNVSLPDSNTKGIISNDDSTDFMDATLDSVDDGVDIQSFSVSKNYEVAAGEEIKQEISVDPNKMDYWEEEPSGLIYLNYSDVNTIANIIKNGKRKEVKEGFLSKAQVGNK